jgi:hypothetical protein
MVFRLIRILPAVAVVSIGAAALYRALGLDGFDGYIVKLFLLVAGMLLVSLTDRELFWAIPPKGHRR